jgi:hypothetical protein
MNFMMFLIPACLRCRYYQSYLPSRKYDDLGKCNKPNITIYAEAARADWKKCGLEGKWFEPR